MLHILQSYENYLTVDDSIADFAAFDEVERHLQYFELEKFFTSERKAFFQQLFRQEEQSHCSIHTICWPSRSHPFIWSTATARGS